MSDCPICKRNAGSYSKPLPIRLHPTPPNEKAAFVESVCDVLIESRFGPGRTSQLIVNLSNRPELEQAVFFDMSDGELVPCYAVSPVGRNGYQVLEIVYRRVRQMDMLEGGRNERPAVGSPTTLARGSPPLSIAQYREVGYGRG